MKKLRWHIFEKGRILFFWTVISDVILKWVLPLGFLYPTFTLSELDFNVFIILSKANLEKPFNNIMQGLDFVAAKGRKLKKQHLQSLEEHTCMATLGASIFQLIQSQLNAFLPISELSCAITSH
ncbi:hypothetical protein ACJX0J_022808 [Zea mays]